MINNIYGVFLSEDLLVKRKRKKKEIKVHSSEIEYIE